MRVIARTLLVLGALLLALLIGVVVYIDRIASTAIERGATYALGVDTRVGFVRIALLAGRLDASGFRIANQPGFQAPDFLSVGSTRIETDLASLRQDTVVAPMLRLEHVQISLETRDGKTNYGTILANLKRFEKSKPQPRQEAGGGTRFVLKEARITDVTASLAAGSALGNVGKIAVQIPEIRLHDLGAGGGVDLGQLTDVLLKAILGAVAQHGGDLPAVLVQQLQTGLGALGPVSAKVVSLGEGTASRVVGEATQGVAEGAAKAQEEAEKAVRGLGGLLEPRKRN